MKNEDTFISFRRKSWRSYKNSCFVSFIYPNDQIENLVCGKSKTVSQKPEKLQIFLQRKEKNLNFFPSQQNLDTIYHTVSNYKDS